MDWCHLGSPVSCQSDRICKKHLKTYPGFWHVISSAMLMVMVGHEVLSLIATYVGAKSTQALIPHIKSKCLPTFLLALMFGVLATAEQLFSKADWTIAHVMPSADGLTIPGRPVYTLQYMEWGINVPILLILSGYCSMGRPLREVSRPLVVTNVYVILCWAATATNSAFLKWSLIAISLAMYAWASVDMFNWHLAYERSAPQDLPARSIRPLLSSGLVLHLLLYGVVYLTSVTGLISAHMERKSFFALTFGAKIAYSAAFVFIRADEYHKTLTDVLRKVSVSNVGMISILRGSFDIILPCVLDTAGRCKLPSSYSGDMTKLEKILGTSVAGANLKDLLSDSDRSDFASYVRNVVRQADCPQSFSEATLTTQGAWACGSGSMPPIAQVLHSKMQASSTGPKMEATLHLSVVPRSAVSFGKERQLVAAIQFVNATQEAKEAEIGQSGFESFQAKTNSSSGGSTKSGTNRSGDTRSQSAIVANLGDLSKLGVAPIAKEDKEETNEASSDYYGATMTDETMSHLAAFAKQEAFARKAFDARIVGTWEGTVSKALGGYHQRIEFSHDCIHACITVNGKTMEACFRMDCSKEPWQLDIEVLPSGTSCPPPAIPYIFKFHQGSLYLCGPGTRSLQRPKDFAGIGLCIMERARLEPISSKPSSRQRSKASASSKASDFEPDPEFSRNTTAATDSEGSKKSLQNAQKAISESELPKMDKLGLMNWIEEKPAVAVSATLALATAVLAIRKSL